VPGAAWLVLSTAVLIGVWLAVDPRTPDLAAQVYRVGLFGRVGLAVWDTHWYAGHGVLGYSLIYPPLASLLGMRVLGALCVLASSVLFWRLVLGGKIDRGPVCYPTGPRHIRRNRDGIV
jgi:hypothetical protein